MFGPNLRIGFNLCFYDFFLKAIFSGISNLKIILNKLMEASTIQRKVKKFLSGIEYHLFAINAELRSPISQKISWFEIAAPRL